MKRNNWRFEALARAKIIRDDSCQKSGCDYYNPTISKSCSIPDYLIDIRDCIYYAKAERRDGE